IRQLLMKHDLIFSVGGDIFTLSLPSDVEPMPEGVTLIHMDTDPWEIGKNYPAKVAILGDPKATLPELAEAIRKRLTPGATRAAQARAEALGKAREAKIADLKERARRESGQTPISPLALVAAVADAVPDDAVVVDESISSGGGLRELLRSRDAKGFFGLRGGGIGWGLPAAPGIKLAQPSRPVVALVGDGSAMYTIQSCWTAAHDSIPVVWVIFNNASYRILKQRTLALKGFSAEDDKYVAMDLVNPRLDYVGLAKAQGVPGELVEKSADVGPAIHRGLASGGPYVIDVRDDGLAGDGERGHRALGRDRHPPQQRRHRVAPHPLRGHGRGVGSGHDHRPQVHAPGHPGRGPAHGRARARQHHLRLLGGGDARPRPHRLCGGQGRRHRVRAHLRGPARPQGRARERHRAWASVDAHGGRRRRRASREAAEGESARRRR